MIKFVQSLWWFISKNWYRYVAIVVVGLLLTVLNLVPAAVVKVLTQALQEDQLTLSFLMRKVVVPYLVTIALLYGITTTKKVLQNRLKVKLYYALQVRYMENILCQDAPFFEHFQSGDLLTRALGDVKSVNFSGANRLLNIFLEAMTVVVTLVAMMMINWVLTLLCLIPLSCIFLANLFLKKKVK